MNIQRKTAISKLSISEAFPVGNTILPKPACFELNDLELEKEFNRLAKKWKEELESYSFTYLVYEHESYLEIIKMSEKALPFILKDLKETKNYWFPALVKITGEDPVDRRDVGDLNRMTECWLNWAKIKNIQY